jgi:hypothetical protein
MEIKLVSETEHLRFEWFGGAYIAVFSKKHDIEIDVINVWDYETDKPVIERTMKAFETRITEWLAEPADTSDIR